MTLTEIIEKWQGKRALVVGDPMVDIYHFGRVERISPEAPVPVFVCERTENRFGGAANVAANLDALGLNVMTIFPPKPWTEKTRFMVGSHQLLRVDEDEIKALPSGDILEAVVSADVVVLSDYAKGALDTQVCRSIIAATGARIPVVVDPKGSDWDKYSGSTVICPNEQEWKPPEDGEMRYAYAQFILWKLGSRGVQLWHDGPDVHQFPALARHVYDVTGAGDTVTAVVSATLGAGGTIRQAAELAMIAAGYVVGEVGTTVCPLDVLRRLANERP